MVEIKSNKLNTKVMWYNQIFSLIIGVLQSAFAFGVLYWDVRIAIVLPYEILQKNGAFESNQKLKMAAIFGVVVSILCLLISFVAEIEREITGNTGLVINIGWVSILQVLLFYWLAFREKACKMINDLGIGSKSQIPDSNLRLFSLKKINGYFRGKTYK